MNTAMKSLIAATMIAGLAATTAMAQATYSDHFMTNWDENSDGKVTLEETIARRDAMFAAFDADSDGFLTPEELKTRDQMREEQWKGLAEQGIQPGHPKGGMGQGMNGPGHGQGMGQGWGMRQGQGHGMRQGQGMGYGNDQAMRGQGMGQGMGMRQGQGMGMRQGRGMDTDRDGRVSKAEFAGMSERWFARFDRNADGAIDPRDF